MSEAGSKMSNFFKSHFGNKKTSSSINIIKKFETKISVKKAFKKAFSKVTNPIMKLILKTEGKEDFEKTLSKISETKIRTLNPIHAAIFYAKFMQIYDTANASKILIKFTPRGAKMDIERIAHDVAENFRNPKPTEPTYDKLTELAKRILKIKPVIWKKLMLLIDSSFKTNSDSKGNNSLVQMANTKATMSESQVTKVIEEISSDTADSSKQLPTIKMGSESNSMWDKIPGKESSAIWGTKNSSDDVMEKLKKFNQGTKV